MNSRRSRRSLEISPRPFDGGTNPFADDTAPPIPATENPLAAPSSDEIQPYKPTDFEQTQSDRSFRTLLMGAIGACFIAASVLIAIVVATTASVWSAELVYCWPADLVGLALCIPAWLTASKDLRAIEAGVQPEDARKRTRIAYWCGMLGTSIGAIPFLVVIMAIIASFFQ